MNALLSIVALLLMTLWTVPAAATPTFPGDVVNQLGLPAITIDPPSGCKLCHVNEAGGDPLSDFGSILKSFGAAAYNDASLRAALANVQSNYPQLITDIEQGVDPNTDTTISNRETPEYGCSLSPAPLRQDFEGLYATAGLILCAAIHGVRRMSRSRRSAITNDK